MVLLLCFYNCFLRLLVLCFLLRGFKRAFAVASAPCFFSVVSPCFLRGLSPCFFEHFGRVFCGGGKGVFFEIWRLFFRRFLTVFFSELLAML